MGGRHGKGFSPRQQEYTAAELIRLWGTEHRSKSKILATIQNNLLTLNFYKIKKLTRFQNTTALSEHPNPRSKNRKIARSYLIKARSKPIMENIRSYTWVNQGLLVASSGLQWITLRPATHVASLLCLFHVTYTLN